MVHQSEGVTGRGLWISIALPSSLTGVASLIVVMFRRSVSDDHGPQGVLASVFMPQPRRVITGLFNPSTSARCGCRRETRRRGLSVVSPVLAAWLCCQRKCHGERFDWLDKWVSDPSDIIRPLARKATSKRFMTHATRCNVIRRTLFSISSANLATTPVSYEITGRAWAAGIRACCQVAWLSRFATRRVCICYRFSGTIGAGDRLKELYGTKIVAVECSGVAQRCSKTDLVSTIFRALVTKHIPSYS